MDKPKGFTLVELLVVISIIALLLSILMPALSKIRKQAKSVICQSNLDQWGKIFLMYANDNDGYFSDGCPRQWVEPKGLWMNALRQYHDISEGGISCCPMATEPVSEGGRQPFAAWGVFGPGTGNTDYGSAWKNEYGSYGMNDWVCNRDYSPVYPGEFTYWRTTAIRGARFVPLFLDSTFWLGRPQHTDNAPEYNGMWRWQEVQGNEMIRFCLDRHDGYTNGVFVDFSVRKIGLKELWKLKWHPTFDTNGPWTMAGGVISSDWPEWMKGFEEY